MPFTPKSWQNAPSTATPISAAALVDLETRLSGYTDTSVTLAALAAAQPFVVDLPENHGAVRNGVTDDTAAIQAAVDTAVAAGIANGSFYAEVWFSAGIYQVTSTAYTPNRAQSFTNGNATSGANAQIQLPYLLRTGQKFTLVLRGVRDASSVWSTGFVETGRAAIRSTMSTNPNTFATFGSASVIGGPTSQQIGQSTSSNLLAVIDGLSIITPANSAIVAVDLQSVTEAKITTLNLNGSVNPATFSVAPSNGSVGLRMPLYFGEDNSEIGRLAIMGHGLGLIPGEHTNCESAVIFYCKYAVAPSVGANHAIRFGYLSTEGCTFHLSSAGGSLGVACRIHIDEWDVEDVTIATTQHLDDATNRIVGEVDSFHRYSTTIPHWGGVPLVNGGANFSIHNGSIPSGSAANLSVATLSGALSTGAAITTMPVQALQSAIPAGVFTTVSGANNQAWTTTGAAVGATTIPVTSQTPNFAYPTTSIITVTMPTSATPFTNPYWRDAVVNITGGTVTAIAVDGVATGLTSGTVIVPSGKTIAITYSVAPTWVWTLL